MHTSTPQQTYNPFDYIKARYLLPITFFSVLLFVWIPESATTSNSAYFFLTGAFGTLIAFALIVVYAYRRGLNFSRLFGKPVASETCFKLGYRVVLPLIAVALACITLVYLPLSYVLPEFVKFMIVDSGSDTLLSGYEKTLPNYLISFFIVVVLAPLFEEFLFRGLLFHRFARKWGTFTAVVVSSVIFGILHADMLGAAIFAVVMCMLYIKTRSLWVPIAVHAMNNLIAWSFSFMHEMLYPNTKYTLATFQSEWYIGAIAMLIAAPWLVIYFKRHWVSESEPLPYAA